MLPFLEHKIYNAPQDTNPIICKLETRTQQPLAQGNDLRMLIFAFSPLLKKQ